MGIHHSPHTHTIPIPMGIPMGIPIATAALLILEAIRRTDCVTVSVLHYAALNAPWTIYVHDERVGSRCWRKHDGES